MTLTLTLASILVFTGTVWVINKTLSTRVCPICAGVSLTWLWMLAGMSFGWLAVASYQLLTAVLMGGSVVGVAYQTEKFLHASRSTLLWKTIFIPTGFAAVYSLVSFWWTGFIVATVLMQVFAFKFMMPRRSIRGPKSKKVEELTRKMKDCC